MRQTQFEDIKRDALAFNKSNMISMVAFKNFAGIWFHKGALFADKYHLLKASSEKIKATCKYKVASVEVLNETGLKSLVLEAVEKQNPQN